MRFIAYFMDVKSLQILQKTSVFKEILKRQ